MKSVITRNWMEPALGDCSCSDLRRTSRAVSSFYDSYLEPVGLTITQYSLLINIGRLGCTNISALSAALGMERTTLTRNLKPLLRQGWVGPAMPGLAKTGPGKIDSAQACRADKRLRTLQLTTAGLRKLNAAYPKWEEAQRRFSALAGRDRLEQVRRAMRELVDALSAAAPQVYKSQGL